MTTKETVRSVLVAIVIAATLAVSAYATTAMNEWRIADNDHRYVSQDSARIAEANRLDEKISRLKWELSKDPNNGYLRNQLEVAERSLRRLEAR